MDAAQLTKLFALLVVAAAFGRFVLTSLDRAESGFASLFVPPDRTLGWPHGVQEGDEPWAWRAARSQPLEVLGGSPAEPDRELPTPVSDWSAPRAGALVVPVGRVAPVRFRLRPN
jgi:hypothetical protein